jgi:DUF4097 and DUF4098 domain-containing protein YvlB
MGICILPLALALAGCDGSFELAGKATDEWTRDYPLADGGEFQISNTNGLVEIEGVSGSTVDVRAERVAHAATDSDARELLAQIAIQEDVTPTRISIESGRTSSSSMRFGYEVNYHVRVPKNTIVRATTTNGRIVVIALAGKTTATTTNGGVSADALTGGIAAKSTNGMVKVELAALGAGAVDLRTTNGLLWLTLPVDAKGDLDASVTNGVISVTGLKFEASDQSRRHVSGRINGGGTPITASTTNGAIRIGTQ